MNLRNIRGNPNRRSVKRKGQFELQIELTSDSITKPLAERIRNNIQKMLQEVGAIGCVYHTCTINKRRERDNDGDSINSVHRDKEEDKELN